MKSLHLTVYTLITLFLLVMATVATVALTRSSNSTGIDPSQIKKIRDLAQT